MSAHKAKDPSTSAAMPSKSSRCSGLCSQISRHKSLDRDMLTTPLARCLTTRDLTFLGLSYMIGPGIYVVTGTVVRMLAGSGAILSYVIAGLAALLAAMCYAECGSRIPLAGSAYAFTYVSIGEIWAFIVGWNMLLEYLIVVSSSAKAWSATFDALCDKVISKYLISVMGFPNLEALAPYPDFLAVALILMAAIFVVSGAKTSVTFNNILAILVVISIMMVIGVGMSNANIENWTNSSYGGFLPYGFKGVLQGAATCFYSYIGFDGIAVAAEEAINPKEALPWAIGVSMLSVTVLYVLATTSLTLLVPYWVIDAKAPYTIAFAHLGITWAKYAVSFGSLIAITTSITGGMYFLPRVAYSMASDGLLFSVFGTIHEKTQTPIAGTMILAFLASVLALFIELDVLVLLMSIGTLISFSFVAVTVVILRCREPKHMKASTETDSSKIKLLSSNTEGENTNYHGELFEVPGIPWCGLRSWFLNSAKCQSLGQERVAILLYLVIVVSTSCLVLTVIHAPAEWWAILLSVIFALGIISCTILLSTMTQHVHANSYQVPLVPFVPVLSVVCSLTMIFLLDVFTWIRLVVWMALGFVVYFSYGLQNSKENKLRTEGLQLTAYGAVDRASKAEGGD